MGKEWWNVLWKAPQEATMLSPFLNIQGSTLCCTEHLSRRPLIRMLPLRHATAFKTVQSSLIVFIIKEFLEGRTYHKNP